MKKANKFIFAIILVVLGILFRTVWHFGPNVEFVTAATLVAGSYLGLRWALIVPFLIMCLSDIFIGNTNIFLFTWSAYLFIGCLGNLSHLSDLERGKRILHATGLGIAASLWFYLWTNFGVWLLDSWGMYPKTPSGLLNAYILAIPFLKYNLMGNLVFIPLTFVMIELVLYFVNFPESSIFYHRMRTFFMHKLTYKNIRNTVLARHFKINLSGFYKKIKSETSYESN